MCVGVAAGEWARYLTRVVYLSATEAEKEEAKRAIRSMHQYDVKVDKVRSGVIPSKGSGE
jgi:ribosomal protein L23